MSSNKVIYGLFDDDDKVLHATKTLVRKGYTVNEVFSFPVHGLDTAMGYVVEWQLHHLFMEF